LVDKIEEDEMDRACYMMEEIRNVYKIMVGKHEQDLFKGQSMHGRMTLKLILRKLMGSCGLGSFSSVG
jgi:hypothetical protein